MINKKINTTEKDFDIPFHRSLFFVSIGTAILFLFVGLLLSVFSETYGTMGNLLMILAYFIPSILAWDLISAFREKYKIVYLKHPKRIIIILINLFLGLTVVGWLVALFMACRPGQVNATVEIVETLEERSAANENS